MVGVIVSEDGSFGESLLKHVENFLAPRTPFPRRVLAEEAGEWNNNARVIVNESSIEISKT